MDTDPLTVLMAVATVILVLWKASDHLRAKKKLRRDLYEGATAGVLDSQLGRAQIRAAGFKDDEVEFVATWKKEWDQWANPRPNESRDEQAFRMKKLKELQSGLDKLLLG